ncbi:hypothetical protein BUALT_Bualt15G0008000 [Buddleja alternifolia]|uniref:BOI-related E3 ubiquitin-protein ligase 3 n=1 Tax=Buddleja alternifolia TaxID=168488 RepID=A0AAV6WDC0_9LAMI|nr:hypothetical protein BUALT_Bualt15G0008000 [Buddleja alternifolia]
MAIQAHMYSENLGFALGAPQEQQQQQPPLMQFHNLSHHKNIDFHQSIPFSHTISPHVENQRIEMDRFINLQNERLRMALQEQRKQQISQILKIYESKTQFLIKQKEEQIAKATNRTMELEDFLRRIEIENQTWQRVAKENESMVASLNSTIERLRETATANAAAEDAECCNSRNSCVIMLPCRHLCSCRNCDAILDSCPVCNMVKKASIEALI